MSQKEIEKKLGKQRRRPEVKTAPEPKKVDPNARRNLYITIAIAVLGLVLFYFIQRATPVSAGTISPVQYQSEFVEANIAHLLLDVRTPEEFATGHIAGAVNIPLDALESRLSEVSKDQPVVVYCRSGNRSAQAADLLESAGYDNIRDLGGIAAWTAAGFAVE
jgi:rhodanese-related sulfurtransferase